MAHMPLGVKTLTVKRGDAAGLLSAMLQRVQAQRGEGRGLRRVEDAEDPAFEPGRVIVGVSQIVGILGD
jgi:hypothetical protein